MNKILLIIALLAAALSVFNIVAQVTMKNKQAKQEKLNKQLQENFKAAQQADEAYKQSIKHLQEKASRQQQKIDSLNKQQAALNKQLQAKQAALQDIKQLLLHPKTSFSDSTAKTILNNLPK